MKQLTLLCEATSPWIIEYWSQLTFILLGVGYVIKTICDAILKKREITYSQVTQNKISELKLYIKSYNELVFLLKEYHFAAGQNQKSKLPDIQEKVYKSWINFITSYGILRVFLKASEYPLYEEVKVQLEEIQKRIVFNEIDKSFGIIDKDSIKKLWEITEDIFPKKLPELIAKIEWSLKKDMKIK